MKYAITDIETTGSRAGRDKITEIAIILTDGKTILDEYTTLINPEQKVSPFITRLTGINNEMLKDAPKFYEVAKKIQLITKEAVFVAHNVRFDYGFLKTEFRELGGEFLRKTLCTVRLSRKLIPGLKSYSLGNLCADVDIPLQNRHRAYGDVKATQILFHKLLALDSEDISQKVIQDEILTIRYPPHFNKDQMKTIPELPGVYSFYDTQKRLLYIGKSVNMNKRVISHFQTQGKKRIEKDFINKIAYVDFEESGNELMALLFEAKAIKEKRPLFNKALRRKYYRFGIFLEKQNKTTFLKIHSLHNHEDPFLEFGTQQAAKKFLTKLCEKYDIDLSCTNLVSSSNQTVEPAILHEHKIKELKKKYAYPYKNFMILGEGNENNQKTVILIEDYKLQGIGFLDGSQTYSHVDDVKPHLQYLEESRDFKRIILSFLQNPKKFKRYTIVKDKKFFANSN